MQTASLQTTSMQTSPQRNLDEKDSTVGLALSTAVVMGQASGLGTSEPATEGAQASSSTVLTADGVEKSEGVFQKGHLPYNPKKFYLIPRPPFDALQPQCVYYLPDSKDQHRCPRCLRKKLICRSPIDLLPLLLGSRLERRNTLSPRPKTRPKTGNVDAENIIVPLLHPPRI